MRGYFRQNAIALDQQLNALLGGAADETLSSRAWRVRGHPYWGWTHRAINALFFLQKNHCLEAYEAEVERKQLPAVFQRGA